MKRSSLFLAMLVCFASACKRAEPTGAQVEKHSEAQRKSAYIPILEEGLTDQFDFLSFPRGDIEVMSAQASLSESPDPARSKYPIGVFQLLTAAQRNGLLTFSDRETSPADASQSTGSRFLTVTPTEELLKLQHSGRSSAQVVVVPIGKVKVMEITEDKPHEEPGSAAGDEYRLVHGLIRDTPSPQAVALGAGIATTASQTFKFRALLQYHPSSKTYTYKDADVGKPNTDDWMTHYLE